MKKKLLLAGLFYSFFTASGFAAQVPKPFKFVIVADEGSAAHAAKVIQYFRSILPFSRMGSQISFTVVQAKFSQMGCRARTPSIPRLINCDDSALATLAAKKGPNLVLGLFSKGASGGAGGGIPVASIHYPIETLVHETLHTFGLGDEYEYDAQDAPNYCYPPRAWPNSVCFKSSKSKFKSDAEAKKINSPKYRPWADLVAPTTQITTSLKLGTTTGLYPKDAAALYRGSTCNKVIPCWKPYYAENIMSGYGTNNIPPLHQRVIQRSMSASRGVPIQLTPPRPSETDEARSSDHPGDNSSPAESPALGKGDGESTTQEADH